jgi:uncharacterized protein
MTRRLSLTVLADRLAVCRLPPDASVPTPPVSGGLWSATRTAAELSLVLPEEEAPPEARTERGWRALQVAGPLDFGLTGILASLAAPLAEVDVSIFAISTYDTDYLLVRDGDLERAKEALRGAGHEIV